MVGPAGGNGRLNMSRDDLDGGLRSSYGGMSSSFSVGSATRWKHSSRVGVASGTSQSASFGQRQSINTISGMAMRPECSVCQQQFLMAL